MHFLSARTSSVRGVRAKRVKQKEKTGDKGQGTREKQKDKGKSVSPRTQRRRARHHQQVEIMALLRATKKPSGAQVGLPSARARHAAAGRVPDSDANHCGSYRVWVHVGRTVSGSVHTDDRPQTPAFRLGSAEQVKLTATRAFGGRSCRRASGGLQPVVALARKSRATPTTR